MMLLWTQFIVQAQFDAPELITQREKVSADIRDALNLRADNFNIILDDVAITQLTFGAEFTRSVEHKQVAQQDAERAKYVVEQAEQEKLATIIRAEGDAQAGELISSALEQYGSGLVEMRKIDVRDPSSIIILFSL